MRLLGLTLRPINLYINKKNMPWLNNLTIGKNEVKYDMKMKYEKL